MIRFFCFGILMIACNSPVRVQSVNDRIVSQFSIVLLHQKRQLLCSNMRIKLIVAKKQKIKASQNCGVISR